MKVTYFNRESRITGYSIEGIFCLVQKDLAQLVDINEFTCSASLSRFRNTFIARKRASEINHITGDVNFLAIGLVGRKIVLTVHDLGHYYTLKQRNRLVFLLYKLFWWQLPLRLVSRVTAVSLFTKNQLQTLFNFPDDKIKVIYDPVKPVFQFLPRIEKNDAFQILQIGSGAHKNLANLIKAVSGLPVQVVIVGNPSDEDQLVMKKIGLTHTIYSNLTDEEIYARYCACDILFFASFYEGFGMPVIESQAVGRPVITSRLGAMKEVAGNSAVLVDPANVEEIRWAVESLSRDKALYDDYVTRGNENSKRFNHKVISGQYLSLYEELARQ